MLSTDQALGEVSERIGDEDAGNLGFDVALLAVGQGRSGSGHRRGGMGEVVDHHLIGVHAASVADGGNCAIDDSLREIHRGNGGLKSYYAVSSHRTNLAGWLAQRSARSASQHGDQRRQDYRGIAGIDPRELGQVLRHGSRPCASRRFAPGVHKFES